MGEALLCYDERDLIMNKVFEAMKKLSMALVSKFASYEVVMRFEIISQQGYQKSES